MPIIKKIGKPLKFCYAIREEFWKSHFKIKDNNEIADTLSTYFEATVNSLEINESFF